MREGDSNESASGAGLTWAGLLAHWTEFARVSGALPRTPEGVRWRDSAPSIIALHAIACALQELRRLADPGERRLAIDRAAVMITRHERGLRRLWEREEIPDTVLEFIADAHEAHRAASIWVNHDGPGP